MQKIWMQRAIDLSKSKMQEGHGGPFGAVIVKNGVIVAEGYNCVLSSNDPTAHAEVQAIRAASQKLSTYKLEGCEIYTSCEPCPMCLAAIYWARIDCIYYACTKKDAAAIGFDDDFLYKELTLPASDRQIKLVPMFREQGLEAMEAWIKKEDRVGY